MKSLRQNKKGGIVSNTVMGVGGLIIGVILMYVIIQTITGAGLLTANSAEKNASDNLVANLTTGIGDIGDKIPTILLIVAVVFLFGALVLLMRQSKAMGIGGGGSL